MKKLRQYSEACGSTILMGLTMILMVFGRPFAHWHVDIMGKPIFITEFCLGVLMFLVVIDVLLRKEELNLRDIPTLRYWGLWVAWSTVGLIRGLTMHPVFAVRKFAIVYYSVSILLVLMWYSEPRQIRRMLWAIYFAGIAAMVIRFSNIMGIPYFARFGNPSVAMDLAMELAVCWAIVLIVQGRFLYFNWAFLMIVIASIVYGDVRTSWISFAVGMPFLLSLMIQYEKSRWPKVIAVAIPMLFIVFFKTHARKLNPTLSPFAASAYVSTPVTSNVSKPAPKRVPTPVSQLLSKPVSQPEVSEPPSNPATNKVSNERDILNSFLPRPSKTSNKQADANWRMRVWTEMIDEVRQNHLWIGMGFEVPFLPHKWMSEHPAFIDQYPLPNVDPHNSHLAVLYRTGLIGFVLYLSFLFHLLAGALKAVWTDNLDPGIRQELMVSTAGVVIVLVHASFAVVLEGPYMSVPFWVFIGLTLALTRKTR